MKYIILLILVSCANAQIDNTPRTSKYAPKGYRSLGSVSYLNQGADPIIQARREDAFKTMYDACNGDYEIVNEGPKEKRDGLYGSFFSNRWVINFKCKK